MKTKHIFTEILSVYFLINGGISVSFGQACINCSSAVVTGQNASAFGTNATASGMDAIAIGVGTLSTGTRSIALGYASKSQGMSSLALGNQLIAGSPNSMILGMGTTNAYFTNAIANSLMVGFNSNLPTLFVGGADGINTTGKVGIGTSAPSDKLSVNGVIQSMAGGFRFPDGTIQETKAFAPWSSSTPNIFFNTGFVGIGTSNPTAKLDVYGDIVLGKPGENFIIDSRSWIGDALLIAPQNNYSGWDWSKGIALKDNGQVYIGSDQIGGTQNADYKLAVNGKLVSREVVVTTQNWADYVLAGKYSLLSLDDLEQYISMNKHLPEVPTAQDVLANGIQVGDMTTVLLKKIEELTLYLIEHKNRIDNLEHEILKKTEFIESKAE